MAVNIDHEGHEGNSWYAVNLLCSVVEIECEQSKTVSVAKFVLVIN